MRIIESCCCGSTFDAESAAARAVITAASQWRHSHSTCQIVKARRERRGGSVEAPPAPTNPEDKD